MPAGATRTASLSGLPNGDYVVAVRMVSGGVRPGKGGTYLSVGAKVLAQSRSGVEALTGLSISNTANYAYTTTVNGTTTTDAINKTAAFVIDMPSAGVYVRNFGSQIPAGSRVTPVMSLTANPIVDSDLFNPVFMLVLPQGLSLETWTGPTNLPTATKTEIANFGGSTDTLVRFTFPRGTVALKAPRTSSTTRCERPVASTPPRP